MRSCLHTLVAAWFLCCCTCCSRQNPSYKRLLGKWEATKITALRDGSTEPLVTDYGPHECTIQFFDDGTYASYIHTANAEVVTRGRFQVIGNHTLKRTVVEANGLARPSEMVGRSFTSEFTILADKLSTIADLLEASNTDRRERKVGRTEATFIRVTH